MSFDYRPILNYHRKMYHPGSCYYRPSLLMAATATDPVKVNPFA